MMNTNESLLIMSLHKIQGMSCLNRLTKYRMTGSLLTPCNRNNPPVTLPTLPTYAGSENPQHYPFESCPDLFLIINTRCHIIKAQQIAVEDAIHTECGSKLLRSCHIHLRAECDSHLLPEGLIHLRQGLYAVMPSPLDMFIRELSHHLRGAYIVCRIVYGQYRYRIHRVRRVRRDCSRCGWQGTARNRDPKKNHAHRNQLHDIILIIYAYQAILRLSAQSICPPVRPLLYSRLLP